MVVDYERAWTELLGFVAAKTQHGREGLLTRMAQIAAECRVPAGELSRLLRLYGVEVERARAASTQSGRDEPEGFDSGSGSLPDVGLPGRHRTEEVHDGSSNGRAASGNGRRRV